MESTEVCTSTEFALKSTEALRCSGCCRASFSRGAAMQRSSRKCTASQHCSWLPGLLKMAQGEGAASARLEVFLLLALLARAEAARACQADGSCQKVPRKFKILILRHQVAALLLGRLGARAAAPGAPGALASSPRSRGAAAEALWLPKAFIWSFNTQCIGIPVVNFFSLGSARVGPTRLRLARAGCRAPQGLSCALVRLDLAMVEHGKAKPHVRGKMVSNAW